MDTFSPLPPPFFVLTNSAMRKRLFGMYVYVVGHFFRSVLKIDLLGQSKHELNAF